MKYFLLSLTLSLRTKLRSKRFWLILLLTLSTGLLLRWTARPTLATGAIQVGVVLSDGSEPFLDALTRHGNATVAFIPTDEATARSKVAVSQWDCALILPEDFSDRLNTASLTDSITLLTGPGSTVYPLIRETAAAALLELTTSRIAGDYLLSIGIADETRSENLPQPQRVQIEMETLTGLPLDELKLAEESYSRIFRGVIAAALLVWTLFAAVDLGRWQETGAARRMRPGLGITLLALPRLLSAMLPAFLLGIAGLLTSGVPTDFFGILSLALYLAVLTVTGLLLASIRPVWPSLPVVIPFTAASVFVLSPVFVDMTLIFPQLTPLSHWLPTTLYLQGGEGNFPALAHLLFLTVILIAAVIFLDHKK